MIGYDSVLSFYKNFQMLLSVSDTQIMISWAIQLVEVILNGIWIFGESGNWIELCMCLPGLNW